MGIVSLICLILGVLCFAYFIFKMVKISKTHEIGQASYKLEGKDLKLLICLASGTGVLLTLSTLFLAFFKEYSLKFFEVIALIFGPLFVGASLCVGIGSFILYYYKIDLDKKQKNFFKYAFPLGFIGVFLGLFIFSEGIADHIAYPLVNGFSTGNGVTYPNEPTSGLAIKFYGILIVSGALLCYAITDHMLYKRFKKHGLIDTLFIVAFLFGILGARLWYCLVLEPKYFLAHPGEIILGIANGGLAVQGGALLGITVGIIYICTFRKYAGLRRILDIAMPTILLAQAIGRWGNFFNQEVYGAATSVQNLWFLPRIVRNNMLIEGEYRVPLFFIESCMNITGYVAIRYGLGKGLKLKEGLGFQASAYLVWYGMTRVILELFRDSEFEYMQSWYVAFGMIALGLGCGVVAYIVHSKRMKAGLEDDFGEKI